MNWLSGLWKSTRVASASSRTRNKVATAPKITWISIDNALSRYGMGLSILVQCGGQFFAAACCGSHGSRDDARQLIGGEAFQRGLRGAVGRGDALAQGGRCLVAF